MRRPLLAILAVNLFLAAGPLWASDQPPLTDEQVKGYLGTMPALHEVSQNLQKSKALTADPSMVRNPFSDLMARLQEVGVHEQFGEIIRTHGFADTQQWASVANRVMNTYMALTMDRMAPQREAEIQAIRRHIEESAGLTDQQKQSYLKDLEDSVASGLQFHASEAEKVAVRPYMPQLRQMFEPKGSGRP